jgi:hypothetical protein
MKVLAQVTGTSVMVMLSLGATANADVLATAPIHNPHLIQSLHVTYALPGDNWIQDFGVLGGGPNHGMYLFALGPAAPQGASGNLRLAVGGGVQVAKPRVGDNTVIAKPGAPVLRVLHHGINGPVTWWAGTMSGRPEAGGYQRAPKSLDPTGKRWLVYDASTELNQPAVLANRQMRIQATRSVLSAARTIRLQPGPDPAAGVLALPR